MGRGGFSLFGLLARALAMAALAAMLLAFQISRRGEIWHERTYWIVALAAFGGFFAVPLTVIASALAFRLFPRLEGRLANALIFAGAFTFAMGLGYVGYQLALSGDYELNPERPIRGLISAFAQVFAVFLIMSPNYLLFFPLPLLMLAAAFLLSRAAKG